MMMMCAYGHLTGPAWCPRVAGSRQRDTCWLHGTVPRPSRSARQDAYRVQQAPARPCSRLDWSVHGSNGESRHTQQRDEIVINTGTTRGNVALGIEQKQPALPPLQRPSLVHSARPLRHHPLPPFAKLAAASLEPHRRTHQIWVDVRHLSAHFSCHSLILGVLASPITSPLLAPVYCTHSSPASHGPAITVLTAVSRQYLEAASAATY
ncbi:hypothetical protein P153DRAFT_388082 [Dothidotthia symphoricarpi CBS 119687]|uniref:Uncharacterized protein n=1 Tax=Dothidotthia symphoricarpi CBS 119687 TaxID=1392245 RepID=A0A6A6A7X8_9PLEO|nr:uncharacterized protein P153DRAFT_388082 [Dothidotthia symphoricarpi CBS 119687]KAF2126761.1 hypothetical protein P153DRAFT_388082 [Dothidotthia symphoricarpi CBS 119687]